MLDQRGLPPPRPNSPITKSQVRSLPGPLAGQLIAGLPFLSSLSGGLVGGVAVSRFISATQSARYGPRTILGGAGRGLINENWETKPGHRPGSTVIFRVVATIEP